MIKTADAGAGLSLTFHGAARTVTGSCMEFTLGRSRVLVDCGLFQGSRSLETLNLSPFAFPPDKVDAVVLTHAHIDHCGLVPKLVAQGFTGPVWCTAHTADLLEFMLADSGRIQESEAARHNRRRDRAGEDEFLPLYTEADGIKAWQQARPVALCDWFEPAPGFRMRYWNAGHILGSGSVEIEAGGVRMVCSGDLGPEHKAFQPDPSAPAALDYVICESTYGGRMRTPTTMAQRRDLLAQEVNEALRRGGNLLIPTFALERTQELLLDLAMLLIEKRIPNVPVFVDSPLASRATRVFAKYANELEDINGEEIFGHPGIRYVADVSESMRINQLSGAIILAASGMCEAGRIRHHLRHNLHRRDSTVLFVGFQAAGTLGRVIMDGAQRVRLSGEDINVRARIRRIDSYSAHADQRELVEWIADRRPIAGSLFLSHGERTGMETLRDLVQAEDPATDIILPRIGEIFALAPGQKARRTATGRADADDLAGQDWQNNYADFTANLKHHLGRIGSEQARARAIADMRRVLDSYADHRAARQRGARRNRKTQPGGQGR